LRSTYHAKSREERDKEESRWRRVGGGAEELPEPRLRRRSKKEIAE